VCVSVRVRDLARLSQSEFRILAFRHEVRRWVLASVPRVKKRSETFKPREAPESVSVCECVRSKKNDPDRINNKQAINPTIVCVR